MNESKWHFSTSLKNLGKSLLLFKKSRKKQSLWISEKFVENVNNWFSFNFSESIFFATLVSLGSKKLEKTFTGSGGSQIPRLKEYQKSDLVWIFFYVATPLSPEKLSSFILFRFHSEALHLYRSTSSKNRGFVPCVVILIDWNFRKVLSILIHLNIETVYSRQLLVWFHPPVPDSRISDL